MRRIDEILKLITMYRTSHPLAGLSILQSIDRLMTPIDNVLHGDNCCTFRQLVSDMLFTESRPEA